jgi:hypothetical protein
MPTTAQVVISIDTLGNLICEAPGPNGQRRKIEGFELTDLPDVLQDELQFQLIRLNSQAQAVLASANSRSP